MDRTPVSRSVGEVRTADEGRMVQRSALADRVAAVCGDGGIVILAAEAGTGKSVLAEQALTRTNGQEITLHEGAERLDGDGLARLGRALVTRTPGSGAIVTSRCDPGLCRHELGQTGPLLELDGDDLAWTPDDVADGLARWGSDGDPERLAHATDGWCVAVRLAALAGEHALAPTSPPLVDFVFAEALRGAPAELSDALLRLAFMEAFDAGSAASRLQVDEAGAERLIAALCARRLFLRPAGHGAWRVHRLVAAVARHRLDVEEPAVARRLRGRSAAHADDDPQAVADAVVSDPLLGSHAWLLLLDGRLTRPSPAALDAAASGPPGGRMAAAFALLAGGSADRVPALLEAGADAVTPADHQRLLAGVMLARLHGDLGAVAGGAATLEALPGGDLGLRAMALIEQGMIESDLGQADVAEPRLTAAAGVADRAGRPAVVARARGGLALLCVSGGRLSEAVRHADATLAEPAPGFADGRVRAAVALALCAYLRDDLDRASVLSLRARCEARQTRDDGLWLFLLVQEALIAEATGDYDRSLLALAGARATLPAGHAIGAAYAPLLDLLEARLVGHVGRHDEAMRMIGGFVPSLDADLAVARAHLQRGRPSETLAVLAPWVAQAGPGRPLAGRLTWHLLIYALAAAAAGHDADAHDTLEQALDLTAPELIRRPFAEERVRLRPLLERHQVGETKHGAFVGELLERSGPEERAASADARLREPLTDRERTVLGYLPSHMTAAEIAAMLVVSEATVRTHLRHIYDKLGAVGRRDAVRRAAQLGLLAQEPVESHYMS
jgi:LuxR family maltose regulon positive regulatory protein